MDVPINCPTFRVLAPAAPSTGVAAASSTAFAHGGSLEQKQHEEEEPAANKASPDDSDDDDSDMGGEGFPQDMELVHHHSHARSHHSRAASPRAPQSRVDSPAPQH